MIYTVALTEECEKAFKKNEKVIKKGKNPKRNYVGGRVWRTEEEAQRYCQEGCSVYGVIADWGSDTIPNFDNDWNDLLIDAEMVKLP